MRSATRACAPASSAARGCPHPVGRAGGNGWRSTPGRERPRHTSITHAPGTGATRTSTCWCPPTGWATRLGRGDPRRYPGCTTGSAAPTSAASPSRSPSGCRPESRSTCTGCWPTSRSACSSPPGGSSREPRRSRSARTECWRCDRSDRLLHAALHAVSNGIAGPAAPFVDLWLCAAAAEAEEVEECLTTAAAARCLTPLALAVREAEHRTGMSIGGPALHDFAAAHVAGPWDRLALAGSWPQRSQARRSAATVLAVPGRVRYVTSFLLPEAPFLRQRESTRIRWIVGLVARSSPVTAPSAVPRPGEDRHACPAGRADQSRGAGQRAGVAGPSVARGPGPRRPVARPGRAGLRSAARRRGRSSAPCGVDRPPGCRRGPHVPPNRWDWRGGRPRRRTGALPRRRGAPRRRRLRAGGRRRHVGAGGGRPRRRRRGPAPGARGRRDRGRLRAPASRGRGPGRPADQRSGLRGRRGECPTPSCSPSRLGAGSGIPHRSS